MNGEKMKTLLKDKRNWFFLCWPIAFGFYFLAKNSREAAENVFAKGIFKVYSGIMSRLSGIIPFSLAEVLLILFALFILFMIILTIIRLIRKKERLIRLSRAFRDIVLMVGIVFMWFMLGGGTNYYRYDFAEYCGMKVEKYTVDDLTGLCLELVENTNEARRALNIPEGEHFVSAMTNRERAKEAKKAMEKLSEQYEVLQGYYPEPKSVFFSRAMSEFNITGVYFPWTCEANVNVDVPDYSRGSTLCHELVHLKGFMREEEAGYVGYLACVNSDCPELRFSGYMNALIHATNQLYDADRERYYRVAANYDDGIWEDFMASNEYWKQFEDTVFSEAGENINNAYLKANNVEDGTKSYGRMVDLLLAEHLKKNNYVHDKVVFEENTDGKE